MLTNSEHSEVKFYRMFSSSRRLEDVSLCPPAIVDPVKVFRPSVSFFGCSSFEAGGGGVSSALKSTNTNRGGNRKPELTAV
jgi:hypothetical protein